MMSLLQVNYDDLMQISKLFRDDGDDLAQVYSRLRKEMQALQHDWVGEAAETFFAEMEEVLLPALKRAYEAMYFSNDVTRKIVKLIHDADEETGSYFNVDFGADFGAGLFAQAGQGLGTGQPGGDDFGALQFEQAVPPLGSSGAGDDFGALQFEEAVPEQGSESGGGSSKVLTAPEVSKKDLELDEPPESEKDTAAAASGGGGSSGTGTPGDLKDMGKGLGVQPTQVSAVSGGEPDIPDHVFESGASAPAGGSESAPAGSDSGSTSSNDSGGAATGVVGAASAAVIGAAAKALKDKSEQSG